jgi:hypothetical protein
VELDLAVLEGLRQMIAVGGARQLAVGDLRAGHLAGLAWPGNRRTCATSTPPAAS